MVLRNFESMLQTQSKAYTESIRSQSARLNLCPWQDNRYSVMVMQQLYENSQSNSRPGVNVQKC
jgi:hypothetical protein